MFEIVAGEIGDERAVDRVLDREQRSAGERERDESDQAEPVARDENRRNDRDDAGTGFGRRDREPAIESIGEHAVDQRHEERRSLRRRADKIRNPRDCSPPDKRRICGYEGRHAPGPR